MNGNTNSVYYKKNNYGAVALYQFKINYFKKGNLRTVASIARTDG